MEEKREFLQKYKAFELKQHIRAEASGLKGYSKMKKSELIDLIIPAPLVMGVLYQSPSQNYISKSNMSKN